MKKISLNGCWQGECLGEKEQSPSVLATVQKATVLKCRDIRLSESFLNL